MMGRSVRMVPADWEHPKDGNGNFIPLHSRSFDEAEREWNEGHAKWQEGLRDDWNGGWKAIEPEYQGMSFTEWHGERPNPDHHMPSFTDDQRTHLMMYEDTSEGTPISPAFATPEELARWLADNGASAFGRNTAAYERWLPVCKGGWAPSMVVENGRMMSGVEAMSAMQEKPA